MRSIVSGVAGFIGSHLAERLLNEGHKVIGIDKFTPYYSRKIKEDNIKTLLANKNFTFIGQDIIKLKIKKISKDADYIFHLAAQAGVRASWGKDFKIYVDNNISATQVLLESLKENKNLKKLVFASSSSVYGDTKDLPIKEDTLPVPVSPYGVTKLAAEKLCYLYCKNYGVPVVSLRYFSVYGPRQRPDMAFNIFIRKLLAREPLPVFNEGKSTRDFTYVADIVSANILAAKNKVVGEVFNIGGGSRISLNNVIMELEDILKVKPDLQLKENQKGDVQHTWADISKAKKILGYEPKVKIKEGLTEEVKWLQEKLKGG